MNVEMRDFTNDDRDFFIESCKDFYDSDAVSEAVPESFFHHTFDLCITENPYAKGLIFLVGGERAGYALLSFTYSAEVAGLAILLEEAYILPEYRGQGIATTFFGEIEKLYILSGKAKRLSLEVTKENTGAIALYKRLGFTDVEYINMRKDFVD